MKFEDTLLALIARVPSTGYDLRKWLSTEGIFLRANADSSQIYRTLARLIDQGFVEYLVDAREASPDAKVYSLTAAGVDRLRELTQRSYTPPARWQEPDFMLHYGLLVPFNPPSIVPLLETEIEFRRHQVSLYRNRDRSLHVNEPALPVDLDFMRAINDDLHYSNAAAVDTWIAWLESELEKWSPRYGGSRLLAEQPVASD
jgi:PadR family transcriptional regulator AphA